MRTPPREPVEASARDEAAFVELYDRTAERVYGVVLQTVLDPAQAADVTRELYLELWRHAPPGTATTSVDIAALMEHARRRAVDRIRSVQASDRTLACRVEICPRMLERRDVLSEAHPVRRALASLTETERRSIEMSYFCAHTPSEVARILQIPLGTVTTQIRWGLIQLRRSLQDCGGSGSPPIR